MVQQLVTKGYKPEKVLAYFEELCKIPHGSGNEEAIAKYIENFAKKKGLFVIRDANNNVFIRKEATEGYENAPAYLLQGHTDMVCAKLTTSNHDFERDALDLYMENGWLRARGTTLGGDDGIAVAFMLALLDGEIENHPTIECLFTVEEETGLGGAESFDYSVVTAKKMINLDSESEGEVCAGCAGGVRSKIDFKPTLEASSGDVITLAVDGLFGGHSGVEINCGRANAIILTSNMLSEIAKEQELALVSIFGGEKDNAIPRMCEAKFVVEDSTKAVEVIEKFDAQIREGLCESDAGLKISVSVENDVEDVKTLAQSKELLDMTGSLKVGVLAMSAHLEGLVEFSRNLGVIEVNGENAYITYSSRSSKEEQIDLSITQVDEQVEKIGANVRHTGRYPGWDFLPESDLRDTYVRKFKEIMGVDVQTVVIHAGLECGIIKSRISDMDIISIGPNMRNIHTPDEALDLDSCARLFEVLKAVLSEK
ncbi:MAG: beta-Ala-His dipeptidase [Clostridia bacterium]|nr:beta-Ala-His dipeptidase [Clostridia bacterium]